MHACLRWPKWFHVSSTIRLQSSTMATSAQTTKKHPVIPVFGLYQPLIPDCLASLLAAGAKRAPLLAYS